MNNEEKILTMLTELKDTMNEHFEQVDKRLEQSDKRFQELEERLDETGTCAQRTAVILENDVARNVRLLFEGHEAVMEKLDSLASKDRVEALESDVSMLKDVIRLMRQEIDALKKAQ